MKSDLTDPKQLDEHIQMLRERLRCDQLDLQDALDLKARLACPFSIGDHVTGGAVGESIGKVSGVSFDDSNDEQVLRIIIAEGLPGEYPILVRERWFSQLEKVEEKVDPTKLYVVRLYDGFDNQWIDVSGPVSRPEAEEIWKQKTDNGSHNTKFEDIDYYNIFPANTKMLYSNGFGER